MQTQVRNKCLFYMLPFSKSHVKVMKTNYSIYFAKMQSRHVGTLLSSSSSMEDDAGYFLEMIFTF